MRPIQFSAGGLPALDDDSIALSQTPLAAGNLTLAGALMVAGVFTPTAPGYLIITTAADESAKTLLVTGKSPEGWAQTETIAGPNATTGISTKSWGVGAMTIYASAAFTGAVKVGTTQSGYGPWRPLDIYVPNCQTAISTDVTGTVDYTWQYTNDDPFDPTIPHIAVSHPVAALVGATTDQTGQSTAVMRAVRQLINSGGGTTRNTITQQSTQ